MHQINEYKQWLTIKYHRGFDKGVLDIYRAI